MEKEYVCVVIWYNPDESSVKNISAYNEFFKNIIIVDNSNNNNLELANKINNSIYIPNNANLGIAKALNIGCKLAVEKKYTWCMTMDQDSSWDLNELKNFFDYVEKNNDKLIISFAPMHSNKTKSLVGEIKQKYTTPPTTKIIFRNKVMTSGNLINLDIWNKVKGFNEDLFIDEVDHEFCYKLINNGYKICEYQDIYMYHTLGNNNRKTILPRICKHKGVRLFYIYRNMLFIKKNYPQFFKENNYKKYMLFTIVQKIYEFKFKDLKYIRQGKNAFKKNIYGSYENYLKNIN